MKCGDTSIEILDAHDEDAAVLLHVQRLAFHQQGILYNDKTLPPLTQTLDELKQEFKVFTILKAEQDGKIVGSVKGRIKEGTCHISRLFVHPEYQNRGIGKRLLLAIEDRFSGSHRYELFTGHKSVRNLSLYEKLGYVQHSRKQQSEKVTLLCLEKRR
jgi:ribosomal protein S18 acetylase RimI-like enzyme